MECSGTYLAIAEPMPVSATACAEIDADASVCVIAHHGSGTGMTVSTAAAITAGSCATGSNAPVAAPCSAITTKAANYEADPSCQHSVAGGVSVGRIKKASTFDHEQQETKRGRRWRSKH